MVLRFWQASEFPEGFVKPLIVWFCAQNFDSLILRQDLKVGTSNKFPCNAVAAGPETTL